MDYNPAETLIRVDPKRALGNDPVRSLQRGSLVRLNIQEMSGLSQGSFVSYNDPTPCYKIPYTSDTNSFEKLLVISLKDTKNITFMILSDLDDNTKFVHGWVTVVNNHGEVEKMAKGWFDYNILVRCIDFSEEDDS